MNNCRLKLGLDFFLNDFAIFQSKNDLHTSLSFILQENNERQNV